ncbi:hypothetical protein ACTHGU_03020 [Chitinophagaceae bacterium MMS25-I14]
MKKFLLATLLLPFAFTACDTQVTKDKKIIDEFSNYRDRSMELITLIDTLVQGYGLSDWGRLADSKEVIWKNKGLAQGKDRHYNLPYARNGEVYVTTDGKFSHFVLEERKKPVIWEIDLSGSRNGYSNIVLSNGVSTHDFEGFDAYLIKKKYLISRDSFTFGEPIDNNYAYKWKLKIKNRVIYVAELISGGGNAGANIALYFNSQGTADIKIPE